MSPVAAASAVVTLTSGTTSIHPALSQSPAPHGPTVALNIGTYNGDGTVTITNGGSVLVADETYVGSGSGGPGMASLNFGTKGGTLTTKSFFASPSQLAGTGTITTRGLVSDVDLIFDSTHRLQQTLLLQQFGRNVTINLDMATNPTNNGSLGVGWKGTGSLTIQSGIAVNSVDGYVGYGTGSTGVATVAGAGSTWTNSNSLEVGYFGTGTLSITSGGTVRNADGFVGDFSGSRGSVTVDGTGSTWANSSDLHVDDGTLSISNGGAVGSRYGYIGRRIPRRGHCGRYWLDLDQ